jgi:general secretion pathway protein E
MKIEPYLVSSTVVGVIAQRLVRVLCPTCRQDYTPSTEVLEHAGLKEDHLEGASIYRAQGCAECFQTGYRGRTGIYELLVVDETVQAALIQSPEANTIRRVAIAGGMQTLFEAGLKKVRQGVTTLEEVLRVTAV